MKKLEMNKRIIIIFAAIAVLIIAVVIGVTMCGKKEQAGSDKDKNGKDNIKTEQNDDKDTDNGIVDKEGGLQILGPDEADKQEDTNKVEFANPDGSSNGNATGTDGTIDEETPSDEGEKGDKEENPDDGIEDKEQYGEFF